MEEEKKVEVELKEELNNVGYIKTVIHVKPVPVGYRVAKRLGKIYKVSEGVRGDEVCISFSEYRDIRIDDVKKIVEEAVSDCRDLKKETLVFYL